MKYDVVKDWDYNRFVWQVQERLNEGWQLQGGVSMAVNAQNNTNYFAQAIVKSQETDDGA